MGPIRNCSKAALITFAAAACSIAHQVGGIVSFNARMSGIDAQHARILDACCQMCPAIDQAAGSYFPGLATFATGLLSLVVAGAAGVYVMRREAHRSR